MTVDIKIVKDYHVFGSDKNNKKLSEVHMENISARSVVTIPLKTEKWQEDRLAKRFEMCRSIYNAMLGYELKQYNKMLRDPEYKESKEFIIKTYKIENAKEKAAAKKSEEYKAAAEKQKEKLREYGFSEFAFLSEAILFSKHFSQNISSMVASMSIGSPMWVAFDKLLFGNGEMVHFKKFDTFSSVVSDCKSGIRIVGADGKTRLRREGSEPLYVNFSARGGKTLILPLRMDAVDSYKAEMLDRDFKTARIVRKKVKGNWKYSIQLCVVGTPAIRYDKDGNIKNPIKEGKLGIYIDTTSVTIAKGDEFTVLDLSDGIHTFDEEVAELQRYMDTSRRISNPDNYNSDGTIKNGLIENGKRVRLKWTFSKGYMRARAKKANLERRESESRSIERHVLANKILALGNDITINDYPFEYAARRKVFEEGDELTESGRPKKKKKAGKIIGALAPASVVVILDQKLKGAGYDGVKKVKLSDVDYKSEGYKKFYAKQLLEK